MNTPSAEAGVAGAGRDAAFFAAAALLLGLSAAVTIHGSLSMPMPWMRMAGQSWPGAARAFLGMWTAMMVAMMSPALMPVLWRYRRSLRGVTAARRNRLTAVVSAGYFSVWGALGIVVFPSGVMLAAIRARLPAAAHYAPVAAGVLVVVAGMMQLSAWKSQQLGCCRATTLHERAAPADAGSALRYGLRCGLHCCGCCAGLTLILLTLGIMDLRIMAVVTLAISAERLAPLGASVARLTGVIAIAAGLVLTFRA